MEIETIEQHYSLRAVAARLDRSVPTVWRWTRDGTLRSVKIGGSILVPESALRELVERGAR